MSRHRSQATTPAQGTLRWASAGRAANATKATTMAPAKDRFMRALEALVRKVPPRTPTGKRSIEVVFRRLSPPTGGRKRRYQAVTDDAPTWSASRPLQDHHSARTCRGRLVRQRRGKDESAGLRRPLSR